MVEKVNQEEKDLIYLDKSIISDGFIRIYSNEDKLDYDISILEKKNYEVIVIDGEFITTKMELMFDLEQKLKFPDYFGRNYDALIDCLIDYEIPNDRAVIVFRHLNNLDKEHITTLLDIFSNFSRSRIASDERFLTLVQVKDRNFELSKPIGAVNFYLKNHMEN
ncbi:barstar family protein [Aureibacter tunicatorum]|uniref:RNAse (Barnase) inhibitor barstar n=1 Tax=Aureibacter tunicatorum TaxID=866807 RepID=A0AAE3XN22_9BACT|nr:barstar family protein [Aureibacter tunicatorum]MDR6238890.1 RNAse (barnase) inhibitor barstar [Aureibacter tunicatorum]BDD05183.1 hypothetical protein AUTU_26660 [Aureibacter tunicatorum]